MTIKHALQAMGLMCILMYVLDNQKKTESKGWLWVYSTEVTHNQIHEED